jgi:hypothetical protein
MAAHLGFYQGILGFHSANFYCMLWMTALFTYFHSRAICSPSPLIDPSVVCWALLSVGLSNMDIHTAPAMPLRGSQSRMCVCWGTGREENTDINLSTSAGHRPHVHTMYQTAETGEQTSLAYSLDCWPVGGRWSFFSFCIKKSLPALGHCDFLLFSFGSFLILLLTGGSMLYFK